MAAPDDNPRELADEPTQVIRGEEEWPVSDLYRVEPDGAPVDEDAAADATVVAAEGPRQTAPAARRFPVDPVPGVLVAIVAALLVIGLVAWLVSRDEDGGATSAPQSLPTTAPDTSTTPTTTAPGPSEREVPNVSAVGLAEARTVLEKAGFRVRVVRRDSSRPPGAVLGQSPQPGTALEANEVVTLTVARAPAEKTVEVAVPDVVGLAVSDATASLREAGLRREIELVASDEAAGTVLRQSPAPGTEVASDSVVELVAARARPPAIESIAVPDVDGADVADARARLRDLGLRVRIVRLIASEPAGTVVGQSPRAGADVRKGATVTLRVSTGPAELTVPDVIGLDEASARLELEGAGFSVRVTDQSTDDPAEDGLVVAQAPQSGSTAREGATVTITVARLD